MKKIFYKKSFILFLYAISVLIFCVFYQNANNIIAFTFVTISSYIDEPSISGHLEKLSEALQSIQIQFPLRVLTGIVNIYINAVFLILIFKIWNLFSKSKVSIPFYNITNSFYLTLYVNVFNNLALTLFMIITGVAMDYHQNFAFILYSLWIFIINSFIVIYYLNVKFGVLKQTIFYFAVNFVILLLLKLGGYYEWNIF
ncbi:hypothetical protein LAE98_30955 [Bacillus wiedmannii]|uniref:hypothetical protein n=1 Tax=Bacillus wiedmannii TaxID=1890302 RepID=UPI001CBE7CD7|nr:hypothetical protein [Bacillus wiedmannii]MBZ4226405.1 hypothetical protein [Bacillus wiedmannii]